MKGLILKDLMLMKNQRKYFLTVILIAIVISVVMGSEDFGIFGCSYVTFLFAYSVQSTVNYDEFDNGMEFLMTLPISRRTYVQEKYLFGFLITILAWAISGTACLLFSPAAEFPSLLAALAAILFVVLIFLSFSLSLVLKYGSEKGRSVLFGIMGAVIVFLFLLRKLFPGILQFVKRIADTTPFLGFCAAAGLLLIGIPYLISLSIMKKKEF